LYVWNLKKVAQGCFNHIEDRIRLAQQSSRKSSFRAVYRRLSLSTSSVAVELREYAQMQ
jgi:hypothetical protein